MLAAGLAATVCYGLFALVSMGCTAVTVAVFCPLALIPARRGTGPAQAGPDPGVLPAVLSCDSLACLPLPGLLGAAPRRPARAAGPDHAPLRVRDHAAHDDAAGRVAPQGGVPAVPQAAAAGRGAVRDVRISIFGDTGVGKTRFLHAALSSLAATAERAGTAFGFPDQSSQERAGLGLDRLASGQDTPSTPGSALAALTVRLGTGARSMLVHLFDTAGEHFRDPEMHDSLGFLGHSQGLVYVIDPYSIGPVRQAPGAPGRAARPPGRRC